MLTIGPVTDDKLLALMAGLQSLDGVREAGDGRAGD
jgi:hypothetical protein